MPNTAQNLRTKICLCCFTFCPCINFDDFLLGFIWLCLHIYSLFPVFNLFYRTLTYTIPSHINDHQIKQWVLILKTQNNIQNSAVKRERIYNWCVHSRAELCSNICPLIWQFQHSEVCCSHISHKNSSCPPEDYSRSKMLSCKQKADMILSPHQPLL